MKELLQFKQIKEASLDIYPELDLTYYKKNGSAGGLYNKYGELTFSTKEIKARFSRKDEWSLIELPAYDVLINLLERSTLEAFKSRVNPETWGKHGKIFTDQWNKSPIHTAMVNMDIAEEYKGLVTSPIRHPHISDTGYICAGGYLNHFRKAMLTKDYVYLTFSVLRFLENITPSDMIGKFKYRGKDIHQLIKEAKKGK